MQFEELKREREIKRIEIKKDLYSFQVNEESSKRVYVPNKKSMIKSTEEIISMNVEYNLP